MERMEAEEAARATLAKKNRAEMKVASRTCVLMGQV